MRNNVKKNLIFVGVAILIVLMILAIYIKFTSKEDTAKNNNIVLENDATVFGEETRNLSAWVAYWDLNVDEEVRMLGKELKNVSYFAVNFDSSNELVMPENLMNYYNKTMNDYNKYVTIVNDKVNSDGSSLLKDTNLLKVLLSNSDSRSSHIEDIMSLAVKYNFHGVEIDYEQIKNDMKLWDDYILFIDELFKKAKEQGLKVRVVLEPNIPFNKLSFSEGPTYVIMCYNLHGGFSEPGGKASPKFIMELIKKSSDIPGKKDFAIATGGFNWASNGKTTSVSEREACDLLKEHSARVERDEESQCLFFNYKDKDNIENEVWYADKITLKSWLKVIMEEGYDGSIWRLGGNLFEYDNE